MNKSSIHVCVTEASLRESEQDVSEGVGSELLAIEIRPVLDAGPDSSPLGRAFMLRQRGQFDASVQAITAGLRFAPTDFRLLFNRGYLLYKLARFEKALGDFSACWALCAQPPAPVKQPTVPTLVGAQHGTGSAEAVALRRSRIAASEAAIVAPPPTSNWRRMGCIVVRWNMALWCVRRGCRLEHNFPSSRRSLVIAAASGCTTTRPPSHTSARPSRTTSRGPTSTSGGRCSTAHAPSSTATLVGAPFPRAAAAPFLLPSPPPLPRRRVHGVDPGVR